MTLKEVGFQVLTEVAAGLPSSVGGNGVPHLTDAELFAFSQDW